MNQRRLFYGLWLLCLNARTFNDYCDVLRGDCGSRQAFLILDRSNTAAFSQLRQAFSRSRASSYQVISRCSSGGSFAPIILCILMERFPIAVTLRVRLNKRAKSPESANSFTRS